MPTRNKKYKYAIEKELAWLQDDLDIIEDELKKPEAGEGSLRKTELLLRRIWASNEMGRLMRLAIMKTDMAVHTTKRMVRSHTVLMTVMDVYGTLKGHNSKEGIEWRYTDRKNSMISL